LTESERCLPSAAGWGAPGILSNVRNRRSIQHNRECLRIDGFTAAKALRGFADIFVVDHFHQVAGFEAEALVAPNVRRSLWGLLPFDGKDYRAVLA